MSGAQQVFSEAPIVRFWQLWRVALPASDLCWSVAFAIPYIGVLVAFVLYPVMFGIYLGGDPALYVELFSSPLYATAMVNTLIFAGIGVNLKMGLAFLLSGFFMRKRRWTKMLLVVFILPWATPALPAFMSIHWMLSGEWGLLNTALWTFFGVDGPIWLIDRSLALGADLAGYLWKQLPFWTVIFLAGRMSVPRELYEAADIDGATGFRRFVHVTVPLQANLYLVCTLLSTIWTLGDFNTIHFISGGGPAMSTEVLATLGIRYAFTMANPRLGVAAVMSALPILLPAIVLLMRKLRMTEVQL